LKYIFVCSIVIKGVSVLDVVYPSNKWRVIYN